MLVRIRYIIIVYSGNTASYSCAYYSGATVMQVVDEISIEKTNNAILIKG